MPATKQAQPAPPASVAKAPPARRPSTGNRVGKWASLLRKRLIERGEKLLFAGGVVGCLVFCCLGLRHLPYGSSPDALKAEAKKALDDLESGKSTAALTKKLPPAPDVKALKSLAAKKVQARAYALEPLRVPFQDRQFRRSEPKVLPVEQLLASAGYGPVAIQGSVPAPTPLRPAAVAEQPVDAKKQEMERRNKLMEEKKKSRLRPGAKAKPTKEEKPEAPPVAPKTPEKEKEKAFLAQAPKGSHLEYRNWVCLVAAIPYVAQRNEYQLAFHEALFQSPERDEPHYALPQIERAEVIGKRRMRWRPVNVIAALEDHANWAADYPESADPRLIDPDLTEPLPPLVSTNYDPKNTGHPRVKVVVVKQPKPVDEASSADAKDADSSATAEPKKPTPFIGGLRDKKPAVKEAPAAAPSAKPADGNAEKEKPPGPPPVEIVRYRLFRFFDFDVEPGRVYCYRVKLVALNPNYEVPVRFLATPQAAEGLFREGTWSTPSPAVAVVDGTRLLAGNVFSGDLTKNNTAGNDQAPGYQLLDEDEAATAAPLAKILIHFFDFATSQRVNVLVDAGRGSLLNQAKVALATPEADDNPKKPRASSTQSERVPTMDVQTDAVVVDLFGGDDLPGARGRSVPGHVLVLDRYGGYKTLSQADDAATFEKDLPSVAVPPVAGKPTAEQARK